jgi:hypothetical protein
MAHSFIPTATVESSVNPLPKIVNSSPYILKELVGVTESTTNNISPL